MYFLFISNICCFAEFTGSSSKNRRPTVVDRNTAVRPTGGQHNPHLKANNIDKKLQSTSFAERTEEKPSSSDTRPKEGAFIHVLFATLLLMFWTFIFCMLRICTS